MSRAEYYGDYYASLLVGKRRCKLDLDEGKILDYIKKGYSSVMIAKEFGCSYVTILKRVDDNLYRYSDQLRANGKKHQGYRIK